MHLFQLPVFDVYEHLREFGFIEHFYRRGPSLYVFTMRDGLYTSNVHKLKPMYTLKVNRFELYIRHIRDVVRKRFQLEIVSMPDGNLMGPCKHSPNHILNQLNENNVGPILAMLDFEDLCAFARTCKLFKRMCNREFGSRCMHRISSDFPYPGLAQTSKLWRIEDYLFNFGHLIRNVNVENMGDLARIVIGLVTSYAKNIRILELSVGTGTYSWFAYKRFFGPQSTVEHLTIRGGCQMMPFSAFFAPKMTHLVLDNVQLEFDVKMWRVFHENKALKELTLRNVDVENNVFIFLDNLEKKIKIEEGPGTRVFKWK